MTAPASVQANSVNKRPVTPVMKPIGAYTAANVMVMAMMAKLISRLPSSAAFTGSMPPSTWR